MNVYRTDISVGAESLYNQFIGIMNLFTWYDTEFDGTNAKFYINATQYINVSFSSNAFRVDLYSNETLVTSGNVFASQYGGNASVYKNEDALAISFIAGSYSSMPTSYSYTANLIVDKIGNNTSVIYDLSTSTTQIRVLNNSSEGQRVYKPFTPNSIVNYTNTAQIVPFIDVFSGNAYDKIHGILITPWNNTIVDMLGEKWLFTNGFALPAGNGEPTYIYYT